VSLPGPRQREKKHPAGSNSRVGLTCQLSGRSRLAQIESNYGEVLWPKTRNVPTHRVSVKQRTIASTAAHIAKPLELPRRFNAIVGILNVRRKRNAASKEKDKYFITSAEKISVRPRAHPMFERLNVQERRFSAQLFKEG
jgi:hypothetical protein